MQADGLITSNFLPGRIDEERNSTADVTAYKHGAVMRRFSVCTRPSVCTYSKQRACEEVAVRVTLAP